MTIGLRSALLKILLTSFEDERTQVSYEKMEQAGAVALGSPISTTAV